jgi:hypothetical protein
MKRLARFGGSVLLLFLVGIAMPSYALQGQREPQGQQEEQHPKPQQKRREKTKSEEGQKNNQQPRVSGQPATQPRQQGEHPSQQRPQRDEPQQPRPQQESRQAASRPTQQRQQVQRSDQGIVWQQHRARDWQAEHRTWRQRGGYVGYRIPEVRYRAYFGPSHGFRVYGLPMVIIGGYSRFEYEGYWVSFIDPWPPCWSDDWYQTDVVYIISTDDGYYLYDATCPRYRVAVAIYLD